MGYVLLSMSVPSPSIDPGQPSQVTLKTAFTVCFAIVLVAALVLFLLKTLLPLTLTLAASMIAVAMNHLVEWLEKKKLKRWQAIAVVLLGLLVLAAAFFGLLFTPAITQARGLVAEGPKLVEKFRHSALFQSVENRFHIQEQLFGTGGDAADLVKGAMTPFLAALSGAVSLVAAVVTLTFLAIFMLVFGGPLVKGAIAELRDHSRARIERVVAKAYASVGGYLGGLLLICGINATLTTITLAILRVPFFLPLGILAGSSSFVPYVGPIVVGSLITVLTLVTSGVVKAIICAGYFILYGQLEGNVLGPFIFRRTVHVNPLLTLLSILFLAELAGVVGAILAVPAVAVAQIIVKELLSMQREHRAALTNPSGDQV